MADAPLTRDRILDAAEEALRRYGPEKTTVVDVARALGVSHGTVYRHFASKQALREAVAKRWLDRSHARLLAVAEDSGSPAPERLHRWLADLFAAKRRKVLDEPELFATYSGLAPDRSEAVQAHVGELVGQLERIIAEGLADGSLPAPGADPRTAARAVFDATAAFHDPRNAGEWAAPDIETRFEAACALLLRGLGADA